MTVCLSPNGVNRYSGSTPTRLLVATAKGVSILERASPAAPWRITGRTLEGMHPSSLMVDQRTGGIFAGIHGGSLYFSGNGGQDWERRANGIVHDHVYTI